MNSLCVSNVTKYYRDIRALNNVSVEFERNKIYGLLGRNGAGKTTLLNIITGKIFANQGKVTLNGKEVFENAGMNSFRETFRLFMQNSISRKTLFAGRLVCVALISGAMALIDTVINLTGKTVMASVSDALKHQSFFDILIPLFL